MRIQFDDDFLFQIWIEARDRFPFVILPSEMRPYQLQGLNWMVSMHYNGLNGILDDEMIRDLAPRLLLLITDIHQGLEKTLQAISFLARLKHHRSIPAPHLIVVPKSTLQNWACDFERWSPDVQIDVLTGTKEECAEIIATLLILQDFEVCTTSYEICLIRKSMFKNFLSSTSSSMRLIESKTSIPFCRRSFSRSFHVVNFSPELRSKTASRNCLRS
jgi:SNF2 family DNA or RNA helicase